MKKDSLRLFLPQMAALLWLGACSTPMPYLLEEETLLLPAETPAARIPAEVVDFPNPYPPGTILIKTKERRLYFILSSEEAIKYGIGVGRPGFVWGGQKRITAKKEWPGWTPPPQMLKREPDLPRFMKGGLDNPLGARALYLGSTLYRIHGSNEYDTIGQAISSGCFRMTNEDIIDLYDRVIIGAQVIVMP